MLYVKKLPRSDSHQTLPLSIQKQKKIQNLSYCAHFTTHYIAVECERGLLDARDPTFLNTLHLLNDKR